MPIGVKIEITCTRCCRSFMWDLTTAPAHKAMCPHCDGDKEIHKPAPKKKRKRMLTKAERYPDNEDKPKPEYPQEWFLDFHCRSLNEYHNSPHLRVRDKGAAYRSLGKLGISSVQRSQRRVMVTFTSFRSKLVDRQSLYGGSAKGLLDILVRLGWVHDDDEEWSEFKISQNQVLKKDMDDGAQRGTRVQIKTIRKPRKQKTA